MSDIVKNWITDRLGVIVDVESDLFLRMVQNGHLIAQLLHSLQLIGDDQLALVKGKGDANEALDHVTVWLGNAGFLLDKTTKNAITNGSLSAAIKLFYKLYLKLNDKDQLHFLSTQVETAKLRRPDGGKYQVTLPHKTVTDPSNQERQQLNEPLHEYGHVIQWHRNRYASLLEKCHKAQETYKKHVLDKFTSTNRNEKLAQTPPDLFLHSIPSVRSAFETDNCSYEELMRLQKKAKATKVEAPDPKGARLMVRRIQKKNERDKVEDLFRAHMEKMLLTEVSEKILKNELRKLESELSRKMLRQSGFEKQATTKLFEVRQQKQTMLENRHAIEEEIQRKRDDDLVEQVFLKARDVSDEHYRYYLERDRALQLHQKIYAEKLRLQALRSYDLCCHVVEDIVDMALYEGEYRENYNEDIAPYAKKELAALFVAEQPIFSMIRDPVVLVVEPQNEEMEEVYVQEIDRENAVDDKYFDDYLDFKGPWELHEHAPDYIGRLDEMQMAANILGHVVFRLLLTKYPKPSPPPPPDIPQVDIAVCVNNVKEPTVVDLLGKLLEERRVKVIKMEDAINLCLEAYREETTVEYPETQFADETDEALKKAEDGMMKNKKKGRTKEKAKPKQKKLLRKSQNSKKMPDLVDVDEALPPFRDKQLQTPRLFPCEAVVLSPKAELGRLAFEILNLGEALSDRLLVKMFVEYLKSLKDVAGCVLMNYPQNFDQAVLLEEALTSSNLSNFKTRRKDDDNLVGVEEDPTVLVGQILNNIVESGMLAKDDEEKRCDCPDENLVRSTNFMDDLEWRDVPQNNPVEDKNAQFRVSKLLVNPHPSSPDDEDDDYRTYLTAYINVAQSTEEDDQSIASCFKTDADQNDLNQFYQDQGCLYSLRYKVYDLPTVKHLAKLVVGDYTIPPKTSVQIFGESVLYLDRDFGRQTADPAKAARSASKGQKKKEEKKAKAKDTSKSGEIEAKSKEANKTVKEKKSSGKSVKEKTSGKSPSEKKTGKSGKGGKIEDAQVVIVREDKETQIPEVEEEHEEVAPSPEPEPMPGAPDWKYTDLSVPDCFQVALATLWENLEEVYTTDFKELLFRVRLLWKSYVPYMSYVKHYIRDFIARPDDKQEHMHRFQVVYNELDEDMRADDEVKAELHCRIHEFREKLWEVCDTRMREAEEARRQVIEQNWVTKQTCDLTNVYTTQIQLETDRCCDTLQLLNDYYAAQVTKMPGEGDPLEKTALSYSAFNGEFEFESFATFSAFVGKALTRDIPQEGQSPFHKVVDDNFKDAVAAVRSYEKSSLEAVGAMENYFLPNKAKRNKAPREGKGKGKFEKKLPKFTEPGGDVKEAGLKLMGEWQAAIKGEVLRANCRLHLIRSYACKDLHQAIVYSSRTLHSLKNDILDRYRREFKSVEGACDVLARAVEEEMALQPELVLEGARFYIKPSVMLFEEPLPDEDPTVTENQHQARFTMQQLDALTDILHLIAPKGVLPERAFLYLIQDMIVQDAEDGKASMVPPAWLQIPIGSMHRLCQEFFGNVELVDWKDFIVQNLCLSFPDEEELMDTRRQFRECDPDCNEFVQSYQYEAVEFWFEKFFNADDPQEVVRLKLVKDLLKKTFGLGQDTVNYTALLLGFCKDDDPVVGVAKALEVSLGKYVCWQVSEGEEFKSCVRERRLSEERERVRLALEEMEKRESADEVMRDLIDVTVHVCDSCFLEEVQLEEKATPTPDQTQSHDTHEVLVTDLEEEEEVTQMVSSILLEEEFSNVEIGFEANSYPPKAYYLPFDALVTVLMASMPWHSASQNLEGGDSFRQKLEIAYESCRNAEFDGLVLTHEFLNSEAFRNLLKCNFKFVVKTPGEIIRGLIKDS